MTSSDVQTILGNANCEACYGESQGELLKLGLLNRIIASGIVRNFATRASISNSVQISALRTLVESARDHGWWDKCDLIYPFVGGTALAHSQNLKSSSFTISWNGAVTHDANGITGDGATGYGNTGYIPASSGQASLNSASISVYRRTLGNTGGYYFGCRGASAGHQLGFTMGGGNFALQTNDGGKAFTSVLLGGIGASRQSSNVVVYHVGSLSQFTLLSNTIPNVNGYILARNQLGVTNGFSSSNVAGITIGKALTSSELDFLILDWQAFQTALGRQV